MSADITVCVLSLNRAAWLCEALESILLQTLLPKEIIICDNGSAPDVKNAVASYLQRGVRWAGCEQTKTAVWNFRRALAAVQTEFVLMLHDDDRLCADFLEKQVGFLRSHSDVGAVTCNAHLINARGDRCGVLRPQFLNKAPEIYRSSVDVAMCYASDNCLPFSPMTYRTDFARKADFKEEFGKVCDAVFFCDLADAGALAYQAQTLYECRVHGGQDSSVFSDEVLKKFEEFSWRLEKASPVQLNRLRSLLVEQYTGRTLRQLYASLAKARIDWRQLLVAYMSPKFAVSAGLKLIFRALAKKLKN